MASLLALLAWLGTLAPGAVASDGTSASENSAPDSGWTTDETAEIICDNFDPDCMADATPAGAACKWKYGAGQGGINLYDQSNPYGTGTLTWNEAVTGTWQNGCGGGGWDDRADGQWEKTYAQGPDWNTAMRVHQGEFSVSELNSPDVACYYRSSWFGQEQAFIGYVKFPHKDIWGREISDAVDFRCGSSGTSGGDYAGNMAVPSSVANLYLLFDGATGYNCAEDLICRPILE